MPRTKKVKSEAKKQAMVNNTAIQAWRAAAKELGYLQAGKFVPIPHKDTPQYAAIKSRQQAILLEANKGTRAQAPTLHAQTQSALPPAAAVAAVATSDTKENPFIAPIRATAAAEYGALMT